MTTEPVPLQPAEVPRAPNAGAAAFAGQLWAATGGAPELLSRLAITGDGDLPSAFRVTDLAVASIGVAGLAAAELIGMRRPGSDPDTAPDAAPAVTVDRALASTWFGSVVQPIGWTVPAVWDPLARNYRTVDGWIRLHTNAEHHRAAALTVLGVEGDFLTVHRAVSRWKAVELETAIVDAGGCAAVLRSHDEWLAHPQGAAVSREPVLDWRDGTAGAVSARLAPTASAPLTGLRVLDLTRVIAGPVATRFLAGLGAEVLRIDPPDWEEDALVPNMTLGKRLARLDARTPDGFTRLTELLSQADVLVHGYRLGALDRLGLDADRRQQLRPGLVDVSLNAYGFTGPWSTRRGFDSLVQMSSGIVQYGTHWARSEELTPLPVQALDHATGYLLAAAAIRGVLRQQTEGRGSIVRTSLARMAETLQAGDDLPLDGTLSDRSAATDALTTPWGDALMVRPPLTIGDAKFVFEHGPSDLGSDAAVWR